MVPLKEGENKTIDENSCPLPEELLEKYRKEREEEALNHTLPMSKVNLIRYDWSPKLQGTNFLIVQMISFSFFYRCHFGRLLLFVCDNANPFRSIGRNYRRPMDYGRKNFNCDHD